MYIFIYISLNQKIELIMKLMIIGVHPISKGICFITTTIDRHNCMYTPYNIHYERKKEKTQK